MDMGTVETGMAPTCWPECFPKYTAIREADQKVIRENFCLRKDERK